MTLLPGPPLIVRGHPGNAYDVHPICAHPNCNSRAVHAHHLWSRSHLRGQPYEWVKLFTDDQMHDGIVIGNRVGLCFPHHEQVTGEIGGYQARIIWNGTKYWWENRVEATDGSTNWFRLGALWPQPPLPGEEHNDAAHDNMQEGEQCPTCGHVKRKPRETAKPGKLRPTKEWTVTVPDDAEVGADLLDDWIDDFAIVFGMDHYTSRLKRYHVLSLLRGVTLAQRHEIIEMVAEAAGRRLGR